MAYAMTQGEQIVYNEVSAQVKAIKGWSWWTTADTKRADRMAVNRIKDIVNLNMTDPKKSYATANLDVLWANWMAWSKLGYSKLQARMLAGLNNIQVALTLEPSVVTIEKIAEVQATQPVLPAVVPIPAAEITTAPAEKPKGKKLFGIPRKWIVIGGISVITVVGGITYYLKTRKKK